MSDVLLVFHILVALALIGLVLVQRNEGGGLGIGGSGGGMSGFMTGRSKANFLTRFTGILAGIFMLTSLVLTIMMNNRNDGPAGSLVDQLRDSGTPGITEGATPAPDASGTVPAPAPAPDSAPKVE